MKKPIDNKELNECIITCFKLSMDGRVPDEQQGKFLELGNQLRDRFLIVKSKEFDEGTAEFQEANTKIKEVNKKLKEVARELRDLADTIALIGTLISILDRLIETAAGLM